MKKIILFSFLFAGLAMAQSAGKNGLSFLKLSFGAKNAALSDLGVVYANDASALFYNPALLVNNPININLSHNSSMQDLRSQNLAFGFNYDNINFALGVNTTSIDDIEVRNVPGEKISKFNANYFFGSFSAAMLITNNISIGATFKYLYEGLYSDEATGYGIDLGVAYKELIPNLNIGLSLRNLGSMNKLRNIETELPKDIRIGASYSIDVPTLKSKIVVIGGINKYFNEDEMYSAIATDIIYDNLLSLRLGYINGMEARSLSLGFGIFWNSFKVDYAFIPYKYDLGSSNIISVGYIF
ncbi:MAG TPA: PorV/PorQ family protein [Melioribacteraceae bacterium]|nr:PorV/PorQ family protein [Melioribacteraceae bacterium]